MSKQNSEQRLRDYMNNAEFSEFQNIVDEEFEKANKCTPSDCVLETIVLINKLARKLNDDECYEYHEQMKKWFNKAGI
tara:strand:- start:139 stop:372 length:234 start_codon:yes stop_codon:yes gene_type:complete